MKVQFKHRRLNRLSFFINSLVLVVVPIIGSLVLALTLGFLVGIESELASNIGAMLLGIGIFISVIAVTLCSILRLHDAGQSGWFILLSLLPIASFALLIFLLSAPSSERTRWGSRSSKLSWVGLRVEI